MVDILNGNSFIHAITEDNIEQIIAQAQPELMGSESYKRIVGYFADIFRQEGVFQKSTVGDHELSKIYSHAANVLQDVVGQKSLGRKADKHHALFSALYFRDEDFQLFLDKFLPDFLIYQEHKTHKDYQPPQVEEGKIVELHPHIARVIQARSDCLPSRQ